MCVVHPPHHLVCHFILHFIIVKNQEHLPKRNQRFLLLLLNWTGLYSLLVVLNNQCFLSFMLGMIQFKEELPFASVKPQKHSFCSFGCSTRSTVFPQNLKLHFSKIFKMIRIFFANSCQAQFLILHKNFQTWTIFCCCRNAR